MTDDRNPKISAPLSNQLGNGNWEEADVEQTDEISVQIHVTAGDNQAVSDDVESAGGTVWASSGDAVFATVRAEDVFELTDSSHIRLVDKTRGPKELDIPDNQITEGVEITNVDALHDDGVTGEDITIAVIDSVFDVDNPKYGPDGRDQIHDTVGPDDSFVEGTGGLHGTGSTEVVSDMAPDADLVLASFDFDDLLEFLPLMDTLEEEYDIDVMTMSLGFPQEFRIDGKDPYSERIREFTDDGGVFVTSAGNEADGPTWDGPWRDENNNDLLEFDEDGTERLDFDSSGADIFLHWDDDWDDPSNNFELRVYDTDGNLVEQSATTGPPLQSVELDPGAREIEIERIAGSDEDLHFDLFGFGTGAEFTPSTPERSFTLPATSDDPETLTIGAVQATDTGFEDEAEELKSYSSRGPTQDGRNGVDLAAPSRVSQTDNGYGSLDDFPDTGYFGTSAAAPHVGGIAGLLFAEGFTNEEIRERLFTAGEEIDDEDVSAPPNTKIGEGYVDAKGAITAENQTVYTADYDGILYAVDTETGKQVWTFTDPTGWIVSSPTVVDGTVYVGANDGTLYAVDAQTGDHVWTFTEPEDRIESSPTVVDGVVYVGAEDGILYAVDAETGTEKWTFTAPDQIRVSAPNVVGGTVYIGANGADADGTETTDTPADPSHPDGGQSPQTLSEHSGNLYAVDAETGVEEWIFTEPDEIIWGSPTVADGTAYIATYDAVLYAVDAETGDQQWSVSDPAGSVSTSPTVVDGTVYFGDQEGTLFAADAETGDIEWEFTEPTGWLQSPTVADGTVFIGDDDGMLYAVEATTGEKKWALSASDEIIRSSPTVADGTVYVGDWDGTLFAVDTETGEQTWAFTEPEASIFSSPTVVDEPDGGDSTGSRVELGTLGHHHVWAETDPVDDISVSAVGEEIAVGGEAAITISAQAVSALTIESLWIDWEVVDEELDGGTPDNRIAADGVYEIEWSETQETVSAVVTVAPPEETYIGGEFAVTVLGTDGDDSVSDGATIEIAAEA